MGSGHEQLLLHTEVRWLSGAGVTAVVWAARGGEVVFDRNQIRSCEASGWHYVACVSVLFGRYIWPLERPQPVFARPRNSYFAPCRQSARLHTKTRPLAWPHQSRELRHVPQPCRLYHWCRHVQARSQLWGHRGPDLSRFFMFKNKICSLNDSFAVKLSIWMSVCIIQFRQFERMFSIRGVNMIAARRWRSEWGLRELWNQP